MSGTNKSPSICQSALCVCWEHASILRQAVYDSALAFTSCWCRAPESARSESLQPSQVFCGCVNNHRYMHSPMHACGLWDSQEYFGHFQSPYGHLTPHLFLLIKKIFLIRFLFVPTVITASGSYNVKQLLLIFFFFPK